MTEDLPQVLISTYVPGRPRTKGSLKHWCMKDRKHTVRVEEQVADSKTWRMKVAGVVQREALQAYGRHLQTEIPVELRVTYFFRREDEDMPKEPRPTAITVGDLDKLDRNIGDALVSSGVIKDDKYIVRIMSEKRWGPQAGAQIMLMQVPEVDLQAAEGAAYWSWYEGPGLIESSPYYWLDEERS
jgi:Holliday junction resolvase RusA-like endonuclease